MGSGFDGVLSDSWASRRRTSESLAKAGGRPGEVGDPQDGSKAAGIKEEEEEQPGNTPADAEGSNGSPIGPHTNLSQASPVSMNGSLAPQTRTDNLTSSISDLSLGARSHDNDEIGPTTAPNVPAGPPPGITDPATIEWTYLDPQGKIQGQYAHV